MSRDYQGTERRSRHELTDELALAFRSVIAQVVLHNYEVAEAVSLSPRDMQAVHILQLRGSMSPGQLGHALGLASASTTALIDRLESAGYARREPDPDDRRKLLVVLEEAKLAKDLAPRYAAQAQHLEQVSAQFDKGELATVTQFLLALGDDQPPSGS
jgi:DNA-binding MarR family transcriptional regulator